jgi:hypothetical protein
MNLNRRVSLTLGLIALGIIICSGALLFGAGKTTSAQAASPALAVATDEATSTSRSNCRAYTYEADGRGCALV